MKGRYTTIKRVQIEGCIEIIASWEFATKIYHQEGKEPKLVQLEHQIESMAMRIQYFGVIRFVAIHATKNEGYSYWWNSETLQQMLNLDNDYLDDIFLCVAYSKPTPKEVNATHRFKQWKKKRTKLAWALVHIMNVVYVAGHLHNDISLDNIMFHFPKDESCVYIGVYN